MASFGGFKANFLGKPQNNVADASSRGSNSSAPTSMISDGNTLWSLQKKVQGYKSSAQAKTWVTCFAICPFPQHEHFVLLGDSNGNISLLEVNAQTGSSTIGEPAEIDDVSVHDVAWLKNSQSQIVAVSTEVAGTLIIWRVNFEKRQLKIHERWLDVGSEDLNKINLLRCIATLPNVHGLIATAGTSGKILVYNKTRVFPSHIISDAHVVESLSGYGSKHCEIVGLIFKDANSLISAGAADRRIKMWRLEKNKFHSSVLFVFKREISSIALLPSDPSMVYVSCLDNLIYCMDIKSSKPGYSLLGHTVGVNTKIQVSPCGKYLASGSTSNYAFIWGLDPSNSSSFTPQFKMKGHSKCVDLVGWSHVGGNFRMLSASEDGTYRVWFASDPITNTDKEGFGCLENAVVLGNDSTPKNDKEPDQASTQTFLPNSYQIENSKPVPQQTKAKSKIPPLDADFEDHSDSSEVDSVPDEDSEWESECDTPTDEELCSESSVADLESSSGEEYVVISSVTNLKEEYYIDSQGNECLSDHVWDMLSKL